MERLTEVSQDLPFGNDVFRLEWLVYREAMPASTLPADLRNPTTRDLEDTTGRLVVRVATEVANEGRNVLLLDRLHVAAAPRTRMSGLFTMTEIEPNMDRLTDQALRRLLRRE